MNNPVYIIKEGRVYHFDSGEFINDPYMLLTQLQIARHAVSGEITDLLVVMGIIEGAGPIKVLGGRAVEE